ncbi:hypothetical protein LEMLEM_LOCUS11349 [Lemmus lemmus]
MYTRLTMRATAAVRHWIMETTAALHQPGHWIMERTAALHQPRH